MNIRERIKHSKFTEKKPVIEYLAIPNTLIINAVIEDNLEIVKELHEETEESDLVDALWIAAAYKRLAIMKFLIQNGTSPNTRAAICRQHSYPLQIAVTTPNNYQCILYLLQNNADTSVRTVSGYYIWQLAADKINRNLICAFSYFNQAMEEFYTQLPFANLAFMSALLSNPRFVFDQIALMVAATNAVETNALENDINYEPLFLQFCIRQLTFFAKDKLEKFETGWLQDEFMNLSMHLNAYETKNASQNPYALFNNEKEKMQMLYYYELNTEFGERKTLYKDAFKPG